MLQGLIIRPETPADYKSTELMTMRSFWNKYAPGCNEHLLVRIIRASGDYLPQISRVAEWNGRIVGAVYYTRAWIVDGPVRHEVVTFGPLAVEPTLEGNDIGGALMRSTIALARDAGFLGIAFFGEPDYYPRFGFKRGAEYGITDAQGSTYDALMCMPLRSEFSSVKGKLIGYAREHDIPSIVDSRYGIHRFSGIGYVKQNDAELAAAVGRKLPDAPAIYAAGRELLEELGADGVLVTRGELGMVLVEKDGSVSDIPVTDKSEVYDVSGAGDTCVATVILALAAGIAPESAARLSNYASGIAVRKLGTATVSAEELKKAVGEA